MKYTPLFLLLACNGTSGIEVDHNVHVEHQVDALELVHDKLEVVYQMPVFPAIRGN